jgi:uncharacterized membrane protein YdjX (TVP38/TMEM64 family)
MTQADPPQADSTLPRRSLWPRLLAAALLALAVAMFYLFGLNRYFSWEYLSAHRDHLRHEADEHRLLALLLFFLLYTAMAALSVPAAWILTVVAGMLFDRWLGCLVADSAATGGATLAFLSSRYLFQDVVQRRFGERLRRLNEGVEKDGAFYLFTLRLVPAFPFFLINLGMGLTKIRLRTYVWVSALAMLPGSFLYTNVGEQLGRLDSLRGLLISLALLGLVPLLIRKLLQRWRRKKETAS